MKARVCDKCGVTVSGDGATYIQIVMRRASTNEDSEMARFCLTDEVQRFEVCEADYEKMVDWITGSEKEVIPCHQFYVMPDEDEKTISIMPETENSFLCLTKGEALMLAKIIEERVRNW